MGHIKIYTWIRAVTFINLKKTSASRGSAGYIFNVIRLVQEKLLKNI